MSTEATQRSIDAHALRLAFGAPIAFAVAGMIGAPAGFIAATLFLALSAGMRKPPMAGALLGILAAFAILPWAIDLVAGALITHVYLLLGFVGLLLFHGYRMQARAQTRPAGVLIVTMAIITPLVADASVQAGVLLRDALLLNALSALAALVVTFALFPHPPGGKDDAGAPLAPNASDATRHGLTAALAMLPLVAIFLALDMLSAVRVLIVASAVCAATSASETGRQAAMAFGGIAVGGVLALAFSAIAGFWHSSFPLLLLGIAATLPFARRAVEGPDGPLVVSGLTAAWIMVATTDVQPVDAIVRFSLYAALGVGWALVATRAMAAILARTRPATPAMTGAA
jgi:hypothetical protein